MADITSETVAVTEKKMDMTLDDIIKMSKSNNVKKPKNQRISNRDRRFVNNAVQDKSSKAQRFMNTRSSMRQGALAQRRSNFQGNQFPLATEAARKAAGAPIHNKAFNRSRQAGVTKPRVGAKPTQKNAANGGGFIVKRPLQNVAVSRQKTQTLDSLFANMKEQRMTPVISSFRAQSSDNGFKRNERASNNGFRRNGGGGQQRRGVPWARNRFQN